MRITNQDYKGLLKINKLLNAKIKALTEFYTATYTMDINSAKSELVRINKALNQLGGNDND